MIKVTLDKAMLAKLHNLSERLELLDETGRVVGYCQPANGVHEELYVPPMTREEIEARLQEPGGRTLAEILADLRSKP